MRSRPARLTLSALTWIALGAAAFFTVQTQQHIDQRRASLRAFESSARDATDALDDVQAGQQAYVAVGQDRRDWTPKVATFLQTAAGSIDTLRATALSSTAGPSLLDASTAMTQVGNIDRRVREQLAADQSGAAADTVFSEGADTVSSAVSNVDAAIVAEQQAADTFEAAQRRAQMYALAGATGLVAIVLAMLGLASPATRAAEASDAASADRSRRRKLPNRFPGSRTTGCRGRTSAGNRTDQWPQPRRSTAVAAICARSSAACATAHN